MCDGAGERVELAAVGVALVLHLLVEDARSLRHARRDAPSDQPAHGDAFGGVALAPVHLIDRCLQQHLEEDAVTSSCTHGTLTEDGRMIPEDRRSATARTRAARRASQAEQFIVLVAGAGALLMFLVT